MKGLLILLVVLAGVWLWRNRAAASDKMATPKPPPATEPQDMVRCLRCGTHVPGNEAVAGKNGVYCSADHLQQAES